MAVLRREPLRLRVLLCASITLARTGLRCWFCCISGSVSLEEEVGTAGKGIVVVFAFCVEEGVDSPELWAGALGGVFGGALWWRALSVEGIVRLSVEVFVRKKGNLDRILPDEVLL